MDRCRLCDGPVSLAFEARVLGRHRVAFSRCEACRSLQTESPYWLKEAYQDAIAAMDTGAVARNLICHVAVVAVARILAVKGRFLDFGGGTGMLCRLLRDGGFDAYVYDRFAEPVYARPFLLQPRDVQPDSIGLLSAVEVFEHCAHPAREVGELFSLRPQVLLATTIPYRDEGKDWWYLGTSAGQHVFFYSRAGLEYLARKYGYHYLGAGYFHVFSKRAISQWRRVCLRAALSAPGLRLLRIWEAATRRGRHTDADYAMLTAHSGNRKSEADRS